MLQKIVLNLSVLHNILIVQQNYFFDMYLVKILFDLPAVFSM